MKIAILGWGSLIWDPCGLPREGTWQTGGPELPIEFSRISSDGRLTLVIDPKNGTVVPTRFVVSPRADLDDAICDLRARERTVSKCIGYVDLIRGTHRCTVRPQVCDTIQNWARAHRFEGIVWTDLPCNFGVEMDCDFSLERAVAYLKGLPKNVAKQARKYINSAPEEVDTPLRRAFRRDGWLNS
jgi:hypothetical protein